MGSKVLGSLAASLFLSVAITGCTTHAVVHTAPPPERVETVEAAPSAQHFWVKGHWHWDGAQYVWEKGHWETRREREIWAPGHWRQASGGWVWEEGHWTVR